MNYKITWPIVCVCLYSTAGLKLLLKIHLRDFIAEGVNKKCHNWWDDDLKICLHSWGNPFWYQCLYSCECLLLASSCGRGKGNWQHCLPADKIMIWFWPHFCSFSLGLEWELRAGLCKKSMKKLYFLGKKTKELLVQCRGKRDNSELGKRIAGCLCITGFREGVSSQGWGSCNSTLETQWSVLGLPFAPLKSATAQHHLYPDLPDKVKQRGHWPGLKQKKLSLLACLALPGALQCCS